MPKKIQLSLRNIVKGPDRHFKLGELSAVLWKGYLSGCIFRSDKPDTFWTDLRNLLVELYGVPLSQYPTEDDYNEIFQYLDIPYYMVWKNDGSYRIQISTPADKDPAPLTLDFFMEKLSVENYVTKFTEVMPTVFDGTELKLNTTYLEQVDSALSCVKFLIDKDPVWRDKFEVMRKNNRIFNQFMLECGFPYRIQHQPDSNAFVFTTRYCDTSMVFHLGMLATRLGEAAMREEPMDRNEFIRFFEDVTGLLFVLTGEMVPGIEEHDPKMLNTALAHFELPYNVETYWVHPGADDTFIVHREEQDHPRYMNLMELERFVKLFIDEEGL